MMASLDSYKDRLKLSSIGFKINSLKNIFPTRESVFAKIARRGLLVPIGENYFHKLRRFFSIRRYHFYEEMISLEKASIDSPFGNRKVGIERSILIKDSIAYHFLDYKDFWLVDSGFWFLYVRDLEIVVTPMDYSEEAKVDIKDLIKKINNTKEIKNNKYVSSSDKILLVKNGNFAHHICNELQAIQNMVISSKLNNIDEIWVKRYPIGKLENIFDELKKQKIKYVPEDISPVSVSGTIMNVNDKYISDNLKNRLTKYIEGKSGKSNIRRAKQINSSCDFVLWISVKCGGRTIVNQAKVLAEIVNRVSLLNIDLALLVDGVSHPIDGRGTGRIFERSFINKHEKIIDNIVEYTNIREDRIVNLNDVKLTDSFLWAQYTDAYLVHWGTVQHKIGWLTSCPGVVHGNSDLMNRKNDLKMFSRDIGDYNVRFIESEWVNDKPINVNDSRPRGAASLDNYYMDTDNVAGRLVDLVRQVNN